MAIDSATTIAGLDTALPTDSGADGKRSDGGGNFRHLKTVLTNCFKNIDGSVTATAAHLNQIAKTLGDVITYNVGVTADTVPLLATGGVFPGTVNSPVRQYITRTYSTEETTTATAYATTSLSATISPISADSTLVIRVSGRISVDTNGSSSNRVGADYAILENGAALVQTRSGARFSSASTTVFVDHPASVEIPVAAATTGPRVFHFAHKIATTLNNKSYVHVGNDTTTMSITELLET